YSCPAGMDDIAATLVPHPASNGHCLLEQGGMAENVGAKPPPGSRLHSELRSGAPNAPSTRLREISRSSGSSAQAPIFNTGHVDLIAFRQHLFLSGPARAIPARLISQSYDWAPFYGAARTDTCVTL